MRQRLLKQGFAAGARSSRSGLVTRRDDGSEVDRFRNRLMMPIARDTGSVIAFGGRALEKDQVPKYLNSPETPIYSKSRTLYGLNLTKGDLRKAGVRDHRRGLFRLRAGLSGRRRAGRRDLRHGADDARRRSCCDGSRRRRCCAYDPDAAGQGAAEAKLRTAGQRRLRRQRRAAARRAQIPTRFVQTPRAARHIVAQLKQSKPYLEFLLDRAAAGTGPDIADDARREFVQKMLAVRRIA